MDPLHEAALNGTLKSNPNPSKPLDQLDISTNLHEWCA